MEWVFDECIHARARTRTPACHLYVCVRFRFAICCFFFLYSFLVGFKYNAVITIEWAKLCHDSIYQNAFCSLQTCKLSLAYWLCQTFHCITLNLRMTNLQMPRMMQSIIEFDPFWRQLHFKTTHRLDNSIFVF